MNAWLAPSLSRIVPLAFLFAAACGGKVIVDFDGSGGSGGLGGNSGNGGHGHGGSTTTLSGGGMSTVSVGGSASTFSTTSTFSNGGGSVVSSTTTSMDAVVASSTGTFSTVEASSVGPGPSTVNVGVGPNMCDCNQLCADVQACGLTGNQCMQVCNFLPEAQKQCVCNAAPDCSAMFACVQQQMATTTGIGGAFPVGVGVGPMTSTSISVGPGPSAVTAVSTSGVGGGSSASVGVGGGGGSGGGVSDQCESCSNQAAESQCGFQLNRCEQEQSGDCMDLLQCNRNCDWTPACRQECDEQFMHTNRFTQLVECTVCQACGSECASSEVFSTWCSATGGGTGGGISFPPPPTP